MEYAGPRNTIAIVYYHARPCAHDLLMAHVQGHVRRGSGKTLEAFPEDFDI